MASEKFYNNNRVRLPEGYDPSNMELKKQLHENADEKNTIVIIKDTPVLGCGAKKHKSDSLCGNIAGLGTQHLGYGRCKLHGGNATGPRTAEGKAKVSQNSRIHGFYAAVLGPEEQKYFNELKEAKDQGLELEIYALKAKILAYLAKWRKKWDFIAEREGEDLADHKTKVFYKESDGGNNTTTAYYHAGTIEDKPFMRALETLGRLIEKQARLNPESSADLMQQINKELRDASHGQVSVSWGTGTPQRREDSNANYAK